MTANNLILMAGKLRKAQINYDHNRTPQTREAAKELEKSFDRELTNYVMNERNGLLNSGEDLPLTIVSYSPRFVTIGHEI